MRGPQTNELDPQDAELFGIACDTTDTGPDDGAFFVWPDNWETVQVFCAMGSQWRVAGMGGVIGLDYVALEAVMRIMDVSAVRTVFEAVRIMEMTAVEEMNKRSKETSRGRNA